MEAGLASMGGELFTNSPGQVYSYFPRTCFFGLRVVFVGNGLFLFLCFLTWGHSLL